MVKAVILADLFQKDNGKPEYTKRFCYKAEDHYGIYDKMTELLTSWGIKEESAHNTASDVASWCELASIGEVYDIFYGAIRIQIAEE